MAKYDISQRGVEMLRGVATAANNAIGELTEAANTLESSVSGLTSELGPHADTIAAIVEDIRNEIKKAQEPINDMVDVLNEVADDYEDMIAHDPHAQSGN